MIFVTILCIHAKLSILEREHLPTFMKNHTPKSTHTHTHKQTKHLNYRQFKVCIRNDYAHAKTHFKSKLPNWIPICCLLLLFFLRHSTNSFVRRLITLLAGPFESSNSELFINFDACHRTIWLNACKHRKINKLISFDFVVRKYWIHNWSWKQIVLDAFMLMDKYVAHKF